MWRRRTSDPDAHPDDAPSIPFGEPIFESRPELVHAPYIGDITQLNNTPSKKRQRRIGFRPPGQKEEEK